MAGTFVRALICRVQVALKTTFPPKVRLFDSWTTRRDAPVYSRHNLTVSFGWGDRWQRRAEAGIGRLRFDKRGRGDLFA